MAKEKNLTPVITVPELAADINTIEKDVALFTTSIVADSNLDITPLDLRAAILAVLTITTAYSSTSVLLKLYLLSLEGIASLASYVEPEDFTDLEHYSKEQFYAYLIKNLDTLWPLYLQDFVNSLN